jgi:DNA polymerase-3 subunit alpha
MAIVTLEDKSGELEAVIFPSSYQQVAAFLKESSVVVVKGKVNYRDGVAKLVINELAGIEQVYDLIKSMHIDLSKLGKEAFDKLKEKLARFPGHVPVYLQIDTKNFKTVEILVGKDLHVTPSEVLMEEIKSMVGAGNFSVKI